MVSTSLGRNKSKEPSKTGLKYSGIVLVSDLERPRLIHLRTSIDQDRKTSKSTCVEATASESPTGKSKRELASKRSREHWNVFEGEFSAIRKIKFI